MNREGRSESSDRGVFSVDMDRLDRHITALGNVGRLREGGLYRGVYDSAWNEAVELVASWMRESGLHTRRDAVGNLRGRLEGSEPARTVMTGSHIDTVRSGGAYDGALGIHAGLEAVTVLREHLGVPRKSIEVVATCEEEGSRFQSNFWGARAMIGGIESAEAQAITELDGSGATLAEAMRERGFDPDRVDEAARSDLDAFVEVHIEQGRVLEESEAVIGLVDAISGQVHLAVELRGRQDHAGTTPMDLRSDPLAGMAEIVVRIERAAHDVGRPAVATVGSVRSQPGAINVIPASVTFTLDYRHSDLDALNELDQRIRDAIEEVVEARDLASTVHVLMKHEPVPMDPDIRQVLATAANVEGQPGQRMSSGAGHDSQIMATQVPTGMIFVPSRSGLSHTPEEHTSLSDAAAGVRVLARALHDLAY